TWDQVQEQLRTAAPARNGRVTGGISPLIGKLFDQAGDRLTPSHARKQGRKYRYYVSRSLVTGTAEQSPGAWQIPATQIEMLVANEAAMALADPSAIGCSPGRRASVFGCRGPAPRRSQCRYSAF